VFLQVIKGLLIFILSIIFISNCSREKKPAEKDKARVLYEPQEDITSSIREPTVAGTFYPDDPGVLDKMVEHFLSSAREDKSIRKINEPIAIILVPHAGYVVSGRTAAYAYALLEGRDYDIVVLIGSPHRADVHGASVYCGCGFRIPFGVIPVDTDLARAVVSSSELITDNELPHRYEHSLEVQLPFLEKVLDDFAIVPILVMGDAKTLDHIALAIFKAVSKACGTGKSILYIVSTDLSHYPKKEDAVKCDSEILQAFLSLEGDTLLKTNDDIMKRGVYNLACAMCGLDAAYVGIKIANAAGANKAVILHRSVSSDAGIEGVSSEQVVGYASVAVTATANTRNVRDNGIPF